MWKKAFVVLLSLDLLVVIGLAVWWSSLPTAQSAKDTALPRQVQNPAHLQLSIGQDAVNSYLEYALTQQKDMKNVLSYAKVQFAQNWDIDIGLKLSNKVIACTVEFVPTVLKGNLQLHMTKASIGQVPLPTSALFLVFRHLPWPQWIDVDALHSNINLDFSKRPENPYGVRILKYDEQTRLLTLLITIAPKSLAQAKIS